MSVFSKILKFSSIKIKDYQINRNINAFIRSYKDRPVPERETQFLPEILVPCFNHGKYLDDAFSSIPQNIPVTIINDASDDDTLHYIDQLKGEHTFKLINNDRHLYQTGCLNKAIYQSKNNFFIVLNADDVLLKYWPSTMLDLFKRYPTIRLAGGNSIPFRDNNILHLNKCLPEILGYSPNPFIVKPECARTYTTLNSINMTMSGCTFLKSCWEAIGGFWEFQNRVCSFDDRDFQMRASALFDIAILDEPSAFYRVNSSQHLAQF